MLSPNATIRAIPSDSWTDTSSVQLTACCSASWASQETVVRPTEKVVPDAGSHPPVNGASPP